MTPEEIAKCITEDIRIDNGLLLEAKNNEVFYGALIDIIFRYEPGHYLKLKKNFSKAFNALNQNQIDQDTYNKIHNQFNNVDSSDRVQIKSGYHNSINISLKGKWTTQIWAWPGKFEYKTYLKPGIGFNGTINYHVVWDDIYTSIKNGFEEMKTEIRDKINTEEPKDLTILNINTPAEEEDPADWWKLKE